MYVSRVELACGGSRAYFSPEAAWTCQERRITPVLFRMCRNSTILLRVQVSVLKRGGGLYGDPLHEDEGGSAMRRPPRCVFVHLNAQIQLAVGKIVSRCSFHMLWFGGSPDTCIYL